MLHYRFRAYTLSNPPDAMCPLSQHWMRHPPSLGPSVPFWRFAALLSTRRLDLSDLVDQVSAGEASQSAP